MTDGATTDLAGKIGLLVLVNLMPGRRLRVSGRTVKRAISKYNARSPTIDRTTYRPPSPSPLSQP